MSKHLFFYVIINNLSYTELASAFVPQIDFYYIHDDTDISSVKFQYLSQAFFQLFSFPFSERS